MRFLFLSLRLSRIHARELLRNPFCLLMTLATLILTIMLPLAFAHTFGDTARRLARDGGQAFHLIAGIIIAAYAACTITGYERKSGIESITLSKPVLPALLFLSRYAAVGVILLIFSVSTGIAVLLADRIAEAFSPTTGFRVDMLTALIAFLSVLLSCAVAALMNIWKKAVFHSAAFCFLPLFLAATAVLTGFYDRAGHRTDVFTFSPAPEILPATLLVTLALLMFGSMSLTLSTRFKPATVTSFCFAILTAGLISEWLMVEKYRYASPAIRWLLAMVPNWQRFWMPRGVISSPVLIMTTLYAFLYTAAVLTIGCILFQRSEHSE